VGFQLASEEMPSLLSKNHAGKMPALLFFIRNQA